VVAGSEEGATVGVSAITGAAAVNSARVSLWSWLIWARILLSLVGSVGDSLVELMCQSDGPVYTVVQCDSKLSDSIIWEMCITRGPQSNTRGCRWCIWSMGT
jgi:hypothetical protein